MELDDPRNEQGGCDHLVGLTVGNKVENFLLAISQASQMCSRPRCVRRREFTDIKLSHGPANKSCRGDRAKIRSRVRDSRKSVSSLVAIRASAASYR